VVARLLLQSQKDGEQTVKLPNPERLTQEQQYKIMEDSKRNPYSWRHELYTAYCPNCKHRTFWRYVKPVYHKSDRQTECTSCHIRNTYTKPKAEPEPDRQPLKCKHPNCNRTLWAKNTVGYCREHWFKLPITQKRKVLKGEKLEQNM
jgi:hypothetical protein